jgi:monofunctional biosynthetic peptidoglycan transglycosylase
MPTDRRKSRLAGLFPAVRGNLRFRPFQIVKRLFRWALLFLCLYQAWLFTHVLWWKWNNPQDTSFMSIRLEELQQKNPAAKLRYEWVEYTQISNHLKRAAIAAEDGKFLDHNGFDWDGIEQALEKNQQRGKRAAGGSTISQQLAKNLFLSPSKSYVRKIQEAVITVMIETCWDKRRILEVYLNVVEWGEGTFGAQAAAKRHYHTNAANISAAQAARMVVMLPNPRKFERSLPAYAVRYSNSVLRRMPGTRIP